MLSRPLLKKTWSRIGARCKLKKKRVIKHLYANGEFEFRGLDGNTLTNINGRVQCLHTKCIRKRARPDICCKFDLKQTDKDQEVNVQIISCDKNIKTKQLIMQHEYPGSGKKNVLLMASNQTVPLHLSYQRPRLFVKYDGKTEELFRMGPRSTVYITDSVITWFISQLLENKHCKGILYIF